jgi:tricorn protease-like protein
MKPCNVIAVINNQEYYCMRFKQDGKRFKVIYTAAGQFFTTLEHKEEISPGIVGPISRAAAKEIIWVHKDFLI